MKNPDNLPMRERLAAIRLRLEKLEKALDEDLGEFVEEAPTLEVADTKNA